MKYLNLYKEFKITESKVDHFTRDVLKYTNKKGEVYPDKVDDLKKVYHKILSEVYNKDNKLFNKIDSDMCNLDELTFYLNGEECYYDGLDYSKQNDVFNILFVTYSGYDPDGERAYHLPFDDIPYNFLAEIVDYFMRYKQVLDLLNKDIMFAINESFTYDTISEDGFSYKMGFVSDKKFIGQLLPDSNKFEEIEKIYNNVLSKVYHNDRKLFNELVFRLCNLDKIKVDRGVFTSFVYDDIKKVFNIEYLYGTHKGVNVVDDLKFEDLPHIFMVKIIDYFMLDKRVLEIFNRNLLKSINESKEDFEMRKFTSDVLKYRRKNNSIDYTKFDEIKKLYNKILSTVYEKDKELFEKIEEELNDIEFWVAKGEAFSSFYLENGVWNIKYNTLYYDEETYAYYDSTGVRLFEDIYILTMAEIIDFFISKEKVLDLFNRDIMKKINENVMGDNFKVKKFNELFEYETELRVIIDSKNEYKTDFNVGDEVYFFHARDEDQIKPESIRFGWHLSFGKGYGEDRYLPTGDNIPFKILSLIKTSLENFIESYDPKKMSFIAEGDQKASIYLKFFEDLGYKVSKEGTELESLTGGKPYLFKLEK